MTVVGGTTAPPPSGTPCAYEDATPAPTGGYPPGRYAPCGYAALGYGVEGYALVGYPPGWYIPESGV
ncbi:hypothetical protein CPC08DRAFT_715070 [Agrocybe pediades]|nr:hypothetical protein CPC08DRAFT_715070 [Agrocybe pediades]